jgi:hypothetical protein
VPRQNRVTPFGELIATEARGTLMGNRGCIHDDQQRIRRPFALKRWIVCVLSYRGRYRTVMSPGRYTELFFLDEATALAAGHRPCAECQHGRYRMFRDMWAAANRDLIGPSTPSAEEMDEILHSERLDAARKKRTYTAAVSELPAGVMVADEQGVPWLAAGQRLIRWEPGGYTRTVPLVGGMTVQVLTPRSIVRAIREGYPVGVHPSAEAQAGIPGGS